MTNVDTSKVDQTIKPATPVEAVASILKQSKDITLKLQDIASSDKTGEYGIAVSTLLKDIATITDMRQVVYSNDITPAQLAVYVNTMSSFLNTMKDMITKNSKLHIDLLCLVYISLINDKMDVNTLYAHESSFNNEKETQLLHILVHTFRYLANINTRPNKIKVINFAAIPEPYGNILKEYFTK